MLRRFVKLKIPDIPAGKHACRHHVWLPLLLEPEPLLLQGPQPPPLCLPPLLALALCLLRNAWLFLKLFAYVCPEPVLANDRSLGFHQKRRRKHFEVVR